MSRLRCDIPFIQHSDINASVGHKVSLHVLALGATQQWLHVEIKLHGNLRKAPVMYMTGAFETFEKLNQQEIAAIVFEIANLGQTGLSINDPDKRYSLKSLDGDFSGLHLLSIMHVGLKTIDPSLDSQSGLDAE